MTDGEIQRLVARVASDSALESEEAWERLRFARDRVLPFALQQYRETTSWRGRLNLLFHCIGSARTNESAVALGIAALSDRSRPVRYRACMLLAVAQEEEAIPHLELLLDHRDKQTVEDARAAIRSIEENNHNHFVDRDGTGQITWKVGDFCPPPVKKRLF